MTATRHRQMWTVAVAGGVLTSLLLLIRAKNAANRFELWGYRLHRNGAIAPAKN
jgi:hypothetical protein